MAMRCASDLPDLPDLPLSKGDISEDASNDSMLLRFVAEERMMLSLASINVWPGDNEQNIVIKNDTMRKSCLCGTMALSRSDSVNSQS